MSLYPRIRRTKDTTYSVSTDYTPFSLDSRRLRSLGTLPSISRNTALQNSFDFISDSSTVFRNAFRNQIGNQPILGIASAVYVPVNVFRTREVLQELEECERIGDFSRRRRVETLFMQYATQGIGSAGQLVQGSIGTLQEVQQMAHLTTNPILTSLNLGAGAFSSVIYILYYITIAGRATEQLYHLEKGVPLRDWLLSQKNPLEEFKRKQEEYLLHLRIPPDTDFEAIALEESRIWLKQILKKAKEEGLVSESETLSLSPEQVKRWLLQNSHHLTEEMDCPSLDSSDSEKTEKMSTERKMQNFGLRVVIEREEAKWIHSQASMLGTGAVEAALTGNQAEFKMELEASQWNRWGPKWKAILRLFIGCLGASVMILLLFNPVALPIWVPCLLIITVSILWILSGDLAAFKNQWQKGEIRPLDKYLLFTSLLLNAVSCIVLFSLIVASGGSLVYVFSLVIPLQWLIINLKSLHDFHKRTRRPWEYLKEPDLASLEQLLQSGSSEEKVLETIRKMSRTDRASISKMYTSRKGWRSAAWETIQTNRKLKKERLTKILEEIKLSLTPTQEEDSDLSEEKPLLPPTPSLE